MVIGMDMIEAMQKRHSVREYLDMPIAEDILETLREEADACNKEGGLHMQIITNEKEAFGGMIAHYGRFRDAKNYIAVVGKKSKDLDERAGYYGERLVLKAQQLGLNTCWVVSTYSKGKSKIQVDDDEKVVCVIALGYGKNEGVPHKNRDFDKLCKVEGEMPEWFKKGMDAVLLAPTAMNQQKFLFTLSGEEVKLEALLAPCSKIDKGIVKYHFEVASGKHVN